MNRSGYDPAGAALREGTMTKAHEKQPSAIDVAAFIVDRVGSTTTLKLQKLLYYSQAWSVVWDGGPLFNDTIQAWRDGPVVPDVWRANAGAFRIGAMPGGDPSKLSPAQRDTVDEVIAFYGRHDGEWLSELTHRERPWRAARRGLADDAPSSNAITPEMLREFYGKMPVTAKRLPDELERGCDLLLSVAADEVDLLDADGGELDPEEMSRWLLHGPGRAGSVD